MHANLVRWCLSESVREAAAYEQFLIEVSRTKLPIFRHFGLLDSFVLRTSEDTVMFVNLFETAEGAEAAWQNVGRSLGEALEGKLELIERISVRADDLPLLAERYE